MARLERFKYIPMLYRAYQEARDRTKGQWLDAEGAVVSSDSNQSVKTSDSNLQSARGRNQSAKRGRDKAKTQSATRRVPRGSSGRSAAPAQTKGQMNSKNSHAKLSGPRRQRRPAQTVAQGRNPAASLQHVLNELRATKQQLSQLRAIQTQLNRVQMQLDQQLQVLKNSMEADADGPPKDHEEKEKKQNSLNQTQN